MKNVSVALPNDISIPGCTEIEIGAAIQGEVAGGTMMVEQSTHIEAFFSAGFLSCRNTRGHDKYTSANMTIKSLSRWCHCT